MLSLAPYLTAMIGVSILCAIAGFCRRDSAITRCMAVVVMAWIAGYALGELTGDYSHWMANIAIDGLAARLVLRHPAGKMQAALGGTFAVQVAMHVAYGARETWSRADPVSYYEMLTIVAFAQLAILGGWGLGILGAVIADRIRHRHRALDRGEGVGGMGRKA